MNYKMTINLDGCGIYYDVNEPIHLDGLLAYVLAPKDSELTGSDNPKDVIIPLKRSDVNGNAVWHGSALFTPDANPVETLRFWRKKVRQSRLHMTNGSPNLMHGVYREYNMPVPLLLIPYLFGFFSCDGDAKEVIEIMSKIKGIGKKRAYGYGKVVSVSVEEIENDYSHIADGVAMRWLPNENGTKLVRCSPPYWNPIDRVLCCEVGEKIGDA